MAPADSPFAGRSVAGGARFNGRGRLASGGWLAIALLCGVSVVAGCDEGTPATDGGAELARVHPRFEPGPDPMDFGAIPWPDDLYLDDNGRVSLGRLPGEAQAFPEEYPDSLRLGLADLDGFSVVAPVFFSFPPDSLDVTSLPASAAGSTREDSSVFLLDADPASPTAFRRVPVVVHWNARLGQLALRPYDGHPLMPGRRYAAVVTTAVRDDLGQPIGPAPGFLELRESAIRPSDPVLAEAYDRYAPVLASLASDGVDRARVAALAVFTVQTVAPDMRDARAIVWEGEPPTIIVDAAVRSGAALDALLGVPEVDQPGLDVPGGVAHARIGWLLQGRFSSPWLLSDSAGVHGRFRRDPDGRLIHERTEEVFFTLTLPTGDLDRLRVVIFQHGIGGERSAMLGIADALAAAGYAVLAIDSPFHGMRASGSVVDVRHNYGATDGPDGFGDRAGNEVYLDFLGVVDVAGELPAFHPAYPRDVFRQSVVDMMGAVRAVRQGDWSAATGEVGLETLAFAPEPLGFVGVSLGGILGTIFTSAEPEIGAAVLNVTGGNLIALVERSSSFAGLFLPILMPKLGIDPADYDPIAYPAVFQPEIAIAQTLLDRGDSMSFAAILSGQPRHLLFQMAEHDETLPNSATEALARATLAPIVGADPSHTDLSRAEAPVSENVAAGGSLTTRGLSRFAPATHGLLSRRTDTQRIEHPPEPPFAEIDPVSVSNPVDAAIGQLVHFLDSWRSGSAEITAPVL